MKRTFAILAAGAALVFLLLRDNSVSLGDGVLAPKPPMQGKASAAKPFSFKDYTITPLAKFHIKAKVLSKKTYWRGRESDISPIDLALGWGRMSDESVLKTIDISQYNRWYRWQTKEFPIPRREIETHSANMHLVPASKLIERLIKRARKGEIVEFAGFLIRAEAADGWSWKSSLKRTDTGNHACELVWVERFSVCDR